MLSKYMMFKKATSGVVAKVLGCNILVNEFKLQLRHYVRFPTNTIGKAMTLILSPIYGLNNTTAVIL